MSRGFTLASCGMVFGILSVVAAWVCSLIGADSTPDHQTLTIGAGMLVTLLAGVAAASLFQNYAPTLFEHAFGRNNFSGITSPEQLFYAAIYGSLGAFLGYTFGVLVTYAVAPVTPSVTLLMVLSGVLGFVTCWYATTERLPRGVASTVEVRLFYSNAQSNVNEYRDEFFRWADHEGSPYGNYGSHELYVGNKFVGENTFAVECGVTETPTVSVRKLYYPAGDRDTTLAVIASKITGNFTASQIADEVRRMQATRMPSAPGGK